MPGKEAVFEFGLPEFVMLVLVLFAIYSLFFLLNSVANRQRRHLAEMERAARADVTHEEEPAEPASGVPPSP